MARVNLNLPDDLHGLIRKYAKDMGVSVTAWIIFALNTRAGSWSQLKADGKFYGGRNAKGSKVSGRDSNKKEASTRSEPLKPKYDCYDDAITAFCSERGPQPMLASGREEYEEWNKGLKDFVKEFGYAVSN